MGNRRIILELDREPQDLQAVWRLDSIARLIQQALISHDLQMRKRKRSLCLSEVMTILIGFHQSYYRNFKSYYLERVQTQWQSHFPKLVSYNRFIEWIPDTLSPCVAISALVLVLVQVSVLWIPLV